MNINDVFPSKFVKSSELPKTPVRVTVERVVIEEVGQEEKPVMYFKGREKGLVLNKTKANIMAAAFSPETDAWVGKHVEVYATKTMFKGEMVDAIALDICKEHEPGDDDEPFNDDIPW